MRTLNISKFQDEMKKMEKEVFAEIATSISKWNRTVDDVSSLDRKALMKESEKVAMQTILSAYLLYKVSTSNIPYGEAWYAIQKKELSMDEHIMGMVKEYDITLDLWITLQQYIYRCNPEILKNIVLSANEYLNEKVNEPTPESVVKLAVRMLDSKSGNEVVDLGCGLGGFLVGAAKAMPDAKFQGYEIDPDKRNIAAMKADLIGGQMDVNIRNVFHLLREDGGRRYDRVFFNYPFGVKLRNLGIEKDLLENLEEEYPGISKTSTAEWFYNVLMLELMKEDGKAVAIMTNGCMWNRTDMHVRKMFVEAGLVEAVISLPEKMFSYMNVSISMVVLSKNNRSVKLIDATNLYKPGRRINEFSEDDLKKICAAFDEDTEYGETISLEELRSNEYALSLSKYRKNQKEFENGVPFGSVIKSITRGATITAKELDEVNAHGVTRMKYLALSNIQDGMIVEDELTCLTKIEPKYEKYCIKNHNLILSKNGNPYKIAVAEIDKNNKVLASSNLYIIELDEDRADPYYIKAFFESEQGKDLLESISVGATVMNIGVDSLKSVVIPLPDMEKQKQIAQKLQVAMEEVRVCKRKLEKAIDKMNHVYEKESE